MHNEHEMEGLKVLCLLPKQTFAIIFSASPPGCGGPTGIIIFLPPQLRKADGEHFLFFPVSATSQIFSLLRVLLQELPFLPQEGQKEGIQLG